METNSLAGPEQAIYFSVPQFSLSETEGVGL